VKATAFTPLMDTLKPGLDALNDGLAALQVFFKDHQTVAKYAGEIAGLGSAALAVAGGIKAMQAAWGMWKIVSAVGSGESALLGFLKGVQVESAAAGTAMETAALTGKRSAFAAGEEWGVVGAKMNKIPKNMQIGVAIVAAYYGFEKLEEMYAEYKKTKQAQ